MWQSLHSADALSARDGTTGPVTPRSERLFSAGLRVRLGNGTFKVVAQTLTFRIEGSARYVYGEGPLIKSQFSPLLWGPLGSSVS